MPYLSTAVDLQNAQNCTSTAATAACKSMIMCYFDYEDFVVDSGERFLNRIRFKIAPLCARSTRRIILIENVANCTNKSPW